MEPNYGFEPQKRISLYPSGLGGDGGSQEWHRDKCFLYRRAQWWRWCGAAVYATAKAGLIAYTKGLAKELVPHGIRVNGINPGVIATPYHERYSPPELMAKMVANIPMGRQGTSEEVAEVILFLASPAARYMLGETIEVNGGMLMD